MSTPPRIRLSATRLAIDGRVPHYSLQAREFQILTLCDPPNVEAEGIQRGVDVHMMEEDEEEEEEELCQTKWQEVKVPSPSLPPLPPLTKVRDYS